MITKKIVADTMPQALKMVRQQLGENAVIVNTKTVRTGGLFGLFSKQKFEVTAYSIDNEGVRSEPRFSLDIKEKPKNNIGQKTNTERASEEEQNNSSVFHKQPQKLYQFYTGQTEMAEKPSQPQKSDQTVLDELQQMRKMMMNFMMNGNQSSNLPSSLVKWVDRLKQQGVNEEVVEHIVTSILKKHESLDGIDEKEVKNALLLILEEIFARQIPKSNTIDASTRIINMVGPTGVGKTTSIAKLATEQVLKQKRKVAMITTDVYRIAAVEQLKTYAGILNVPIEVVRSAEEMEKALDQLSHYDLIYMDTTGRNYKEVQHRQSIDEFLQLPYQSDHYLVLSLTTKFEDMEILLNEFLDSPIKKLILTKFDETTSYGSILNIAYRYPYHLAYIANGQSVPEDITALDPSMLARILLGEE